MSCYGKRFLKEDTMNDQPIVPNFISSRHLIGSAVHSPSGENLGKVEAFLLDPKNGMVSSVILSSGGMLGLAGKRIAVPWDMVIMDGVNRTISINVDHEFIDRLPPYSGEF
jgi:sporulation protein YlmC with PRC-barrel domain